MDGIDKDRIIQSIDVRSVRRLIEEWAPDFKGDKEDWLLDHRGVKKIFEEMISNRIIQEQDRGLWRYFLLDYQGNMFDDRSGVFLEIEEYMVSGEEKI